MCARTQPTTFGKMNQPTMQLKSNGMHNQIKLVDEMNCHQKHVEVKGSTRKRELLDEDILV